MKYLFVVIAFLALASVSFAVDEPVPIIHQESDISHDGTYHYSYESGDGTKQAQDGALKKIDAETSVETAQGSFSYKSDDGKEISVQYVADENGYQPVGEHIPKTPEPIARALAYLATLPPPKDEKRI